MNFRAARFLALVTGLAGPLGACSVILDPEECTSDSDCVPGVCSDGICIGDQAQIEADEGPPDAAVPRPDGAPGDDAEPPQPDQGADQGPAADAEPVPDAEVDMRMPDAHVPVGPRCAFVAPDLSNRLTNVVSTGVTVEVTDGDTPPESLTVLLNGEAVTLDAEGVYTFEAQLAEGENEFTVVATDPDGRRCEDRITVVADRIGPEIRREEPPGDYLLVGEADTVIRACLDDPRDIGIVQATLRGIPVPAADVSRDGRCLMACAGVCLEVTVELALGENPVTLRAFDGLGNPSEEDAFVLEFDNVPPSLELAEPADGLAIAENRVAVRGSVEDAGDVREVQVVVTVTGPQPRQTRESRPQVDAQGDFTIAALELFGGENHVRACAYDTAGNESAPCAERTLFVELQPPCVEIARPADGAIVDTGEIEICGTSCDNVREVRLEIAGNPTATEREADGSWCGSVRLPNSAEYEITAVATSRAGRTAEDAIRLVVDGTPPVVAIDEPAPDACLRGDPTVRVCGRATDLESSVVDLTVCGFQATAALRANSTFCFEAALPEGDDQACIVVARNRAGRTAEVSFDVTIDRTPPAIELGFAEGAFVAADELGRLSLPGRVVDPGCGVLGNGLSADGRPVLVQEDGTFTARPQVAAGEHTLIFVATDAVGNQQTVRRRVVVDGTPPTVQITAPAPGTATTAANILVSARVVDAESGIASVTVNGVAADLAPGDGFQVATARVPLQPNDNRLVVAATDRVGLVGRATVDVLRDLDDPTVEVTTPSPGDAVESSLFVAGTATDGPGGSGVASVTVNGVAARLQPDGTWSIAGVELEGGQNRLSVFATDRAGNESVAVDLDVRVLDFAPADPERVGLDDASDIAWLGVADLNADGRLDVIALSGSDEGRTATFLQQADQTFIGRDAETSGLRAGAAARGGALGDFNNDGHADVAIAYVDGVELRLGRGNGNFELSGAPGVPSDIDVLDVAAGDLNRDGNLDLLVLAGADSLLLNGSGAGGFINDADEPGGDVPADRGLDGARDATGALLQDLTGDRVQDVVLVGPDFARFFKGDRAGAFVAADPGASGFTSATADRVFPLDADRDGDLDLVAAGADPRFFLYGGNETWALSPRGLAPDGDTPWVAVADLDGDSRDDVLLGGEEGLEHWKGGAAAFVRQDSAATGMPDVPVTGPMQAVDIDGDTDFDLLATTADGLRLVRSNRSVGRVPYHFVRLNTRRGRAGREGPTDNIGLWATANLDDNMGVDRALVAPAFGPILITLGVAEAADLVVHFIDKGAAGGDRRNLDGRQAGSTEAVNAPE